MCSKQKDGPIIEIKCVLEKLIQAEMIYWFPGNPQEICALDVIEVVFLKIYSRFDYKFNSTHLVKFEIL